MTRHFLPRFTVLTALTIPTVLALTACGDDQTSVDDEIGATGTDTDESTGGTTTDTTGGTTTDTTDATDTDTADTSADTADTTDTTDTTDTGDTGGIDPVDLRPLSSMVALSLDPETGATDIPGLVKDLVAQVDAGALPDDIEFPLAADSTDTVRAIDGLRVSVVASWFDPLTMDEAVDAPRYGANNDYISYFGDGWSGAPQYSGSGSAGWMWTNHEYISGDQPTASSGPTSQFTLLTTFLSYFGLIADPMAETWSDEELATVITNHKRHIGGSWFRVVQDQDTGAWHIDRSADNHRYDATSGTLVKVTGLALSAPAHDDHGLELPEGVVPGIMADCSGGQTPWGTILSAEENVQDYYGDVEACWTSQQQLVVGAGCDAGGDIMLATAISDDGVFGAHPDANQHHAPDNYGFLVEIDPGKPANEYYGKNHPGDGHQKLGALGRARWENATFAVGPDWQLVDGRPIVLYAGNDRRGGRIYKFVTSQPYTAGMSRAQIRNLLAAGTVYVAHFADLDNDHGLTVGGSLPTAGQPGVGRWLELSLTSGDEAVNAPSLGGGTTVGEALGDQSWNGLAGFPDDATVRRALWTAATKIGVRELNRPEDVEYNPIDGNLYVAFTNHGRRVALDEDGVLYPPATQEMDSPTRPDHTGAVFVITEDGDPDEGGSFSFWAAWAGTEGADLYDAANPDNLLIDAMGGVWFGTDGNYGTNGHADGLYYLDLDPGHSNTFGKAFRVVAGPSDSEATGPAMSSDGTTLFFSVQHPGEGEGEVSTWPPLP